ncbi:MAG: ATP-binding protein [Bacteroidia bacterium]
MPTPFKFLAPYEKTDRAYFFGREQETQQLFRSVHASPLTLLYGVTGAGKSSLVKCGLSNCFADTDWHGIYVNRTNDLSQDLFNAIQKESLSYIPKKTPVNDAIRDLYLESFIPLYLIFDQFEQLFLSGSKQEQRLFFKNLAQLLNITEGNNKQSFSPVSSQSTHNLLCRVIIIMREEHIGYLSEYEDRYPDLFESRVRLERMRDHQIRNVISQTINHPDFPIQVEEKNQTVKLIMNHLKDQVSVPVFIQPQSDLRKELYLKVRQESFHPLPQITSLAESLGLLYLDKGLPLELVFEPFDDHQLQFSGNGRKDFSGQMESLFAYENEQNETRFYPTLKDLFVSGTPEAQMTFAHRLAALFITGSKAEQDAFATRLMELAVLAGKDDRANIFTQLKNLFYSFQPGHKIQFLKQLAGIYLKKDEQKLHTILGPDSFSTEESELFIGKITDRFHSGSILEQAVFAGKLADILPGQKGTFTRQLAELLHSVSQTKQKTFFQKLIALVWPQKPDGPGLWKHFKAWRGRTWDSGLEARLKPLNVLFPQYKDEKQDRFLRQVVNLFLPENEGAMAAFLDSQALQLAGAGVSVKEQFLIDLTALLVEWDDSKKQAFLEIIPQIFLLATKRSREDFAGYLKKRLREMPKQQANRFHKDLLDNDEDRQAAWYANRVAHLLFEADREPAVSMDVLAEMMIAPEEHTASEFFHQLLGLISLVKSLQCNLYFVNRNGFPQPDPETVEPTTGEKFSMWVNEMISEKEQTSLQLTPVDLPAEENRLKAYKLSSTTTIRTDWILDALETESPLPPQGTTISSQERIDLSNMQVYLDRLHQKAEEKSELITFDPDLVKEVGPLSGVIGDFLDDGLHQVKLNIDLKKGQEGIPLKVLMALVSDEGGKQIKSETGVVRFVTRQLQAEQPDGPPVDEKLIRQCIEKFQEMRIISA